VTRRVRLFAILGVVALLIGGGLFVSLRLLGGLDGIPQGDLFGDGGQPSATGQTSPPASPTRPPGSDIKGPLNILIVGVDSRERNPNWIPRSDSVMVLHVNKNLTKAYLTSLPRDLVVNVPAFAPSNFGGSTTKLAHAMSYGAQVPGSRRPSYPQGFQLVARTVSRYTGIPRFDAGAILTFTGLQRLVDSVGGIDVYVDQKVVSIHRRPDGKQRPVCGSCDHGYSGPAMTYNVGRRHLVGWQAIDYSRQRYTPGGDYTRQRHQRQVIKAIIAKTFSAKTATNPVELNRVLKALAKTLTFDGRGRSPIEYAYALRRINGSDLTLVGLPGSGAYSGGSYIGENLGSVRTSYFAAVRNDTVDAFLRSHSNLVNKR